jgi:hypothetical protein
MMTKNVSTCVVSFRPQWEGIIRPVDFPNKGNNIVDSSTLPSHYVAAESERNDSVEAHRIVRSFLDMLRVYADHYIAIGKVLQQLSSPYGQSDVEVLPHQPLDVATRDWVIEQFEIIKTHCDQLKLSVSSEFLQTYAVRFGQASPTEADIKNCIDCFEVTFNAELKKRIFVFVSPEKSGAFDQEALFGPAVKSAFRSVEKEIREAGNCYALGLNTACVFHCMRTLEAGLRSLATVFGLPFGLEQWHNIIDQVESKIVALKALPKSVQKIDEQEFYSKAATQFTYFKNAWRNHVMHGRRVYDENEAVRVLEHADDFMRHLATKLKE